MRKADRDGIGSVPSHGSVTLVHTEPEFHAIFRIGLREAREFQCVGCYETAREALQVLLHQPSEYIFLDHSVPDADCLQLTRRLSALAPRSGLVLLAASCEKPDILTALLRAGASAIVQKPCTINECLKALHSVRKGDVYLSQKAINALAKSLWGAIDQGHPALLSPAESRVIDLLRDSLSDKEIAGKLGIAPGTVHRHTSSIYRKLRVSSRAEAAQKYFPARQPLALSGF